MGRDNGAIRGESESTDSLVEQYRRHRSEISKIPMYADSILKMLKDIRKAVRASIKLQSDSSVFAQFLEEWWASVVQFLQQSSIVDAERNSREAMQTLKKLKGRQEENKKRERSRLLSKLDDNAGLSPVETTRLSELLAAPASESSNTPDTVANSSWGGSHLALASRPAWSRGAAGGERSSHSSEDSGFGVSSAAAAAAAGVDESGLGAGNRPPIDRRSLSRTKEGGLGAGGSSLPRSKEGSVGWGGGGSGQLAGSGQCHGPSPACPRRGPLQRSPVGAGGKTRGSLKGCVENGGGRPSVGRRSVASSVRSSATTVRSHGSSAASVEGGGGVGGSRVSWDEGSVGTEGTADTVTDVPAYSGLPEEERGSDGDDDDDDDDDNDVFQVADNMDLGAVDLFVCTQSAGTGGGGQGQTTYQDQDELRLPSSMAETPSKRVVEKERFSAALDYFRQEQQAAAAAAATAGRMSMPRPTSPIRNTDVRNLPSPLRASTGFNVSSSTNRNAFARRASGSTGLRIKTPTSRGNGKTVQMRDTPSARDRLPSQLSSGGGKRLARSLSVYIPRSQKTPVGHHRSSKTPTVKSSRRVLMSPKEARKYSRGAFFG